MTTNKDGYMKSYFRAKKLNLLFYFGNRCNNPFCQKSLDLEFAHLRDNGFNGMGRGRQQRYKNIEENKEDYILLCKKCHKEYDDNDRNNTF